MGEVVGHPVETDAARGHETHPGEGRGQRPQQCAPAERLGGEEAVGGHLIDLEIRPDQAVALGETDRELAFVALLLQGLRELDESLGGQGVGFRFTVTTGEGSIAAARDRIPDSSAGARGNRSTSPNHGTADTTTAAPRR